MPNYRRPAAPGFKGAYNALATYVPGDTVTNGGNTYATTVAVPVSGISDPFDGSSLDAAWVAVGTWPVSSGGVRMSSAGTGVVRRNTNAASGIIEVVLIDPQVAGIGVLFRYVNTANYFLAAADGVFNVVAGVFTKISTYGQRYWTSDTTVKVVLDGNQISVYENNVLLETMTNADRNTATLHGIWSQTTNSQAIFKDWKWSPNGVPAAFAPVPVSTFVGCAVYASDVDLTIGADSPTIVPFHIETADTHGFWTSGGNITIPAGQGGNYEIHGQVTWAYKNDRTATYHDLRVDKSDGTALLSNRKEAANGVGYAHQITGVVALAAGDIIRMRVESDAADKVSFATGQKTNLLLRKL
jgi:hypothetical protein